ncbi:MAG: pectate lyase [Prolixibacteraceae bacterium]|jgi:PelA/Pel-15E family pectate lyase|nr:pectate lyase [Prolixibacteraceae bacterium]
MIIFKSFTIFTFLFFLFAFSSQEELKTGSEEKTNWGELLSNPDEWYQNKEAIRIADNIILFQRDCGGWPKNINMARELTENEKEIVENNKSKSDATIDNSSTYTHLRYLAKAYQASGENKYLKSFNKGFDYLIEAQYTNGGWPQFYPLRKGYYTHITFNDDAMTGVMYLLHDIVQQKPAFTFIDKVRLEQATISEQKGLDVIFKTQITLTGKKTGWCAQYNEETLDPADARSYELASISGKETVTLIYYLMSLINPDGKVKQAVVNACRWLEDAKIKGYKLAYIPDSNAAEGYNRVLIKDKNGPDLWARFYNLETGKPLYVDRGGKVCENYNDISYERRNNYAYIEQFAHKLLTEDFPEWKRKHGIE